MKTWAPVGEPLPLRFRWEHGKYTACFCGISSEDGVVFLHSVEGRAFTGADIEKYLQELRDQTDSERPIGMFLDNAKIHKTPGVQETAQRCNIELLFNLPYRPDLNGIERFWGLAKSAYRKAICFYRANAQIYS